MKFTMRVQRVWPSAYGWLALVGIFSFSLWLFVHLMNGLQEIEAYNEGTAIDQKYYRERLRFMSGSIYGNSTPEKTLEAFIAALRAEDVDAALEQIEMSKDEARAKLEYAKSQDKMQELADYYSRLIPIEPEFPGDKREVVYGIENIPKTSVDEILIIIQWGDGRWRIMSI